MNEQPTSKERLMILENDIFHLNKLQQRLSDWGSSVKEQIRLKDKQIRNLKL